MARAGGAYLVRDESAGPGPGNIDKLYPYTLKGLLDALEEARFRSFAGPPQVVEVRTETGMKVIRRYDRGHEIPPGPLTGGPASVLITATGAERCGLGALTDSQRFRTACLGPGEPLSVGSLRPRSGLLPSRPAAEDAGPVRAPRSRSGSLAMLTRA
jgi:hypothetical protein